jgi:hypothetical protein
MVLRELKVQPVLTVRKESKVRLGRTELLGLLVQLALKVRPEPLGLLAVKEFRVSRAILVLLGQQELPGRWGVPALLVLMVKGASKVFEDFKVLMGLMGLPGLMGLMEQVQLVAGRILRWLQAITIVHRLRLLPLVALPEPTRSWAYPSMLLEPQQSTELVLALGLSPRKVLCAWEFMTIPAIRGFRHVWFLMLGRSTFQLATQIMK